MLTSLAPSPIAKVIDLGILFLTNVTICAFYAGLHLYTTQEVAIYRASRSFSVFYFDDKISTRIVPERVMPNFSFLINT